MMHAFEPGPRTPAARIGLRVLLGGLTLLFAFRFALPGIILGGAYIAGGATVTAQLDSETRFLSALALVYVVGFAWLFRNFEKQPQLLLVLAPIAMLGGLSRIASMVVVGMPDTAAIIATGLEVTLPIVALGLVSRRAS